MVRAAIKAELAKLSGPHQPPKVSKIATFASPPPPAVGPVATLFALAPVVARAETASEAARAAPTLRNTRDRVV